MSTASDEIAGGVIDNNCELPYLPEGLRKAQNDVANIWSWKSKEDLYQQQGTINIPLGTFSI